MSHKLVSLYIGDGEYYTRTDADNVISELKKERDWLAKDRAQAYDDLEKRAQLNIKQDAEIKELKAQKAQAEDDCAYWKTRAQRERHHKYRRCLAMVMFCEERSYFLSSLENYQLTYKEYQQVICCYWHRWRKRWLELAEKFKEAK